MNEILMRFFQDMLERPSGPFAFRFVMQPTMAVILAVRAGARDASAGSPPFLYGYLGAHENRPALRRSAEKDLVQIFTFGFVLDALYQVAVFKWFYPMETVFILLVLVALPYVLVRGPANRFFARQRLKKAGVHA